MMGSWIKKKSSDLRKRRDTKMKTYHKERTRKRMRNYNCMRSSDLRKRGRTDGKMYRSKIQVEKNDLRKEGRSNRKVNQVEKRKRIRSFWGTADHTSEGWNEWNVAKARQLLPSTGALSAQADWTRREWKSCQKLI